LPGPCVGRWLYTFDDLRWRTMPRCKIFTWTLSYASLHRPGRTRGANLARYCSHWGRRCAGNAAGRHGEQTFNAVTLHIYIQSCGRVGEAHIEYGLHRFGIRDRGLISTICEFIPCPKNFASPEGDWKTHIEFTEVKCKGDRCRKNVVVLELVCTDGQFGRELPRP
jgi:hypothetical protein